MRYKARGESDIASIVTIKAPKRLKMRSRRDASESIERHSCAQNENRGGQFVVKSMTRCTHFNEHAVGLDDGDAAKKGQERKREVDEALGSTGQNCDSVAVGNDASEDGGNAPGKN